MSSSQAPAVPGPDLPFLPRALLEPRRPLVAILVGWVVAFLPSIALSGLVRTLLPAVEQPDIPIDSAYLFAIVTLFAPAIETLIMAAVLTLLLAFLKPNHAVIASSIGWGIAHSLLAPAWGLVIWWPFLVFSTLFVTWRNRSMLAALAIPAAVHALQNSLPALALLIQARSGA